MSQAGMAERLAAIDSVDKAMAALKECAYLSGFFNHEMRETLKRVAVVLEAAQKADLGVVRIGDPGPSKLGDMRFHKDVLVVDLWYPNIEPDPRSGPRTPDHPVAVEVGLMHVRAADSILIEYDFERDGYAIKQASKFEWEVDDKVCDPDWQEVAFIQAWGRQVDDDCTVCGHQCLAHDNGSGQCREPFCTCPAHSTETEIEISDRKAHEAAAEEARPKCGKPLDCGSGCHLDPGHDGPCLCGGETAGPGSCPA